MFVGFSQQYRHNNTSSKDMQKMSTQNNGEKKEAQKTGLPQIKQIRKKAKNIVYFSGNDTVTIFILA